MPTYWDEGYVTSVYRLQTLAQVSANADYIARAKDLYDRLRTQWFPILSSITIGGDILHLGEDLARELGHGASLPMGAGKMSPLNVLYEEDTSLGGRVGTANQEAFVSGDVTANVAAAWDDTASTVREEATAIGDAVPVIGHQLAIYGRYLLFALAALVVLYVYLRATR